MGYDCTLHLIDAGRVASILVPRLLGTSDEKTAFDKRPDAKKLFSAARASLDSDDHGGTANRLCQLALLWSAAELPHMDSRNLAFSIWDHADKPPAIDGTDIAGIPVHLLGDPESLFAPIVERYPKLHGKFPAAFSSNYATGAFFSPQQAHEAHQWLLGQIAKMSPTDARSGFERLAFMVGTAASRGFCFWEATDLVGRSTERVDWSSVWADGESPEAESDASLPARAAKLSYILDADIIEATGKSWATWFDAIEQLDGSEQMSPPALAQAVRRHYPPTSQGWSVVLADGFARCHGKLKRKPAWGTQKTNKIAKTIPLSLDDVVQELVEPKRLAAWTRVRSKISVTETASSDTYVLRFGDKTEATISLRARGGKTLVAVQHQKLYASWNAGMRALFWVSRLGTLAERASV